jgi:hypothetical protein
MDLRHVVAPINRLINMANHEILKSLVVGREFGELAKGIPSIRKQLSDRIANALPDRTIVTRKNCS